MTSLNQILWNRQLGLSQAPLQLKQAMEQRTADHIAREVFHHQVIPLPSGDQHHVLREGNFAAIISISIVEPKVQRVALWSLITKRIAWEMEFAEAQYPINPSRCVVNSAGLILLSPDRRSEEPHLLAFKGEVTWILPDFEWKSLHINGGKVLSCYDDQFTEWDHEGKSIFMRPLNPSSKNVPQTYISDLGYWIRLSGTHRKSDHPLIEVVDLIKKTLKTYVLPFSKDKVKFSSACIVQNSLFYGKNVIRSPRKHALEKPCESTVGIFNLLKGEIIEEVKTKGKKHATPCCITANSRYIAWSEQTETALYTKVEIKYFELKSRTLASAFYTGKLPLDHTLALHLNGSLLTVTYPKGFFSQEDSKHRWCRKVVDMANGLVIQSVRYLKSPEGTCTIDHGTLLLSDTTPTAAALYVESFLEAGEGQQPSPYRK